MLSTNRLLQLYSLEDVMSSRARLSRSVAAKAEARCKPVQANHFLLCAFRYERIAARCRARLEGCSHG